MRSVYIEDKFHVCILPNADRRWQTGQIYACDCGNLFRVEQYYEGKNFKFFGKLESK